jgi:carboxyl-terminal processing protease
MNRRLFAGTATVVLALFAASDRPAGPPQATTHEADPGLRTFNEILGLVEERYVDEVPSRDLVFAAIRGMLGRLDPHCSFLDPKSFKEMQEEQRGSFSGLGIVISIRGEDKDLTVISPIEGTPAYRAGIRAGDVISHIEGKPTAGITIDEALEKLRGPKGTRVTISIAREGEERPLDYTLVRDDIPTASIPYAFMLRPGVGYIRIKNFTQTTDRELDEKLRALREQGMTKLVLDLRYNPGGLLDQAVKVSERFLAKPRELIVYTKGRRSDAYQEYRSGERSGLNEMPLVVLVNKGSASASEIVAGAIQDHDRGIIVGETTWGKGLVQTVQRLSHNSAIALTTAKYYTPSGRLIQRDYKSSLDDYYAGPGRTELTEEQREARYTDAGRKVLGGGGISPDVEIELKEGTPFEQSLERKSVFFDYAVHYLAAHKEAPGRDLVVGEAILKDFREFAAKKKVEGTEEDWKRSHDFVATMIRAEVLGAVFGLEERQRVISDSDPQILKALEILPQAEKVPIVTVDIGAKPKDGSPDGRKADGAVNNR